VKERVEAAGHAVVIGGELFSDAMGDHPPEDTYVGMVQHNVNTLVGALQ
jgi:manganese/zinc/iron transport system substrate-binding protein